MTETALVLTADWVPFLMFVFGVTCALAFIAGTRAGK